MTDVTTALAIATRLCDWVEAYDKIHAVSLMEKDPTESLVHLMKLRALITRDAKLFREQKVFDNDD